MLAHIRQNPEVSFEELILDGEDCLSSLETIRHYFGRDDENYLDHKSVLTKRDHERQALISSDV